jgi:hypothetical protein
MIISYEKCLKVFQGRTIKNSSSDVEQRKGSDDVELNKKL